MSTPTDKQKMPNLTEEEKRKIMDELTVDPDTNVPTSRMIFPEKDKVTGEVVIPPFGAPGGSAFKPITLRRMFSEALASTEDSEKSPSDMDITPQPADGSKKQQGQTKSGSTAKKDKAGGPGGLSKQPTPQEKEKQEIALTTPQHLPIQEDKSESSAAGSAIMPKSASMIVMPKGYPNIYDVAKENGWEACLHEADINCLMPLSKVNVKTVTKAGSWRIHTGMSTAVASPYSQLVLAAAGRYYSTLPEVNFDGDTFKMLHQLMLISADVNLPGLKNVADMDPVYQEALDTGMSSLLDTLASILLKREALSVVDLDEVMNVSECRRSLSGATAICPAVKQCFKMAFQLLHGGVECIEPVPVILRDDPVRDLYVNSIATGSNHIGMSDISITPREKNMKVVSPAQVSSVKIPDKVPSEDEDLAKKPPGRDIPLLNKFGINSAIEPALDGEDEEAPLKDKSLMAQGFPSRTQVSRDTIGFRENVRLDADHRDLIMQLIKSNERLEAQNEKMETQVRTMAERIQSMNDVMNCIANSLTAVISRADAQELRNQANINRTLFAETSDEAVSIIKTAPELRKSTVSEGTSLIRRLEKLEAGSDNPDLRALMEAHFEKCGKPELSANLGPSSFRTRAAISRWINRISNLG